jgi:hypothetical protein
MSLQDCMRLEECCMHCTCAIVQHSMRTVLIHIVASSRTRKRCTDFRLDCNIMQTCTRRASNAKRIVDCMCVKLPVEPNQVADEVGRKRHETKQKGNVNTNMSPSPSPSPSRFVCFRRRSPISVVQQKRRKGNSCSDE